jgi:hypothetical protein
MDVPKTIRKVWACFDAGIVGNLSGCLLPFHIVEMGLLTRAQNSAIRPMEAHVKRIVSFIQVKNYIGQEIFKTTDYF